VKFGNEEKKGLAEGMEPKKMGFSQDETFHPGTCHGAIEPVYPGRDVLLRKKG
jgi:hypothetical protein